MAVTVAPQPGDGPLSAKGPTVDLTVTTTAGATMTASILTPDGDYLPIDEMALATGKERVTLSLPPGGVPPGSKLILVFDETDGTESFVKYTLK